MCRDLLQAQFLLFLLELYFVSIIQSHSCSQWSSLFLVKFLLNLMSLTFTTKCTTCLHKRVMGLREWPVLRPRRLKECAYVHNIHTHWSIELRYKRSKFQHQQKKKIIHIYIIVVACISNIVLFVTQTGWLATGSHQLPPPHQLPAPFP